MRGIKKKKNILEKANVFFAKENENEKKYMTRCMVI